MDTIRLHDTGAAVEDVQRRLATAGFLDEAEVTGTFDDRTQQALRAFAQHFRLPATDMVDDKTWSSSNGHWARSGSPMASTMASSVPIPSWRCASSRPTWACLPTA